MNLRVSHDLRRELLVFNFYTPNLWLGAEDADTAMVRDD